MKRTWIKIRRGLLEPKHRERLGARIWLYIYILDNTDWNTGTIEGWTDQKAADEMEMPQRTIQDQRQRLAEDGYITCAKTFQAQKITVHNWINPREYSGEVYNKQPDEGEYGEFRTHSTESSVPIHTESSVPLHIVTLNHTKAHTKEAPKNGASPPIQLQERYAQSLEFVTNWTDYVKHRKETKHPLTPTAIQRLFVKFDRYPLPVVIERIALTLEKGWQGVFFDEDKKPAGKVAASATFTEEY